MSIKERLQEEIKNAMKNKDQARLAVLRMAKGALLLKEKESAKDQALTDEEAVAAIRGEIRKRQQSIEIFRQHGREVEAVIAETEIKALEEFLPKQVSLEELEAKVRAYVAAHPEVTHPGKLTGALKQELGDTVDGKALNEMCRKVLGA
jgi:hypothetical protein